MQQLSGAANKSIVLEGKHLPLFKSEILDNYNLLEEFSGKNTATDIPVNVKKLMGIPADAKGFIGAFDSK